ncbi:MAG: hypothetical protein U0798_00780 [Gemmataceae bacterium]
MTFATAPAWAADEPYSARTPPDKIPREHTHDRAGTSGVARFSQSSIAPRDGFGYVNGATFGSDYLGMGWRPGRFFPGLLPDGLRPKSFSNKYATDGKIHVPDPIGAKPFRKAVIEARSDSKSKSETESK